MAILNCTEKKILGDHITSLPWEDIKWLRNKLDADAMGTVEGETEGVPNDHELCD